MRPLYLDHSSSTPVAASVQDAMLPFFSEFFGNPLSSHWSGRAASEAIEDARSKVANLLGCHPTEIVFTSGGTESINLALLGIAKVIRQAKASPTPHLITTRLEHPCVLHVCRQLAAEGWQVSYLNCDADGVVDLDLLEDTIQEQTRVVSIAHANHRIGTIQPLQTIAELCNRSGIYLHTDACQTVGKTELNVEELDVDLLSLSGHKLSAPKGIGALYVRSGVPLEPILYGEGAEVGLRPGTPNVPFIAGLGQACKLISAGLEESHKQLAQTRSFFLEVLQAEMSMELVVRGGRVERVPHILSVEFPQIHCEALARRLPTLSFSIEDDCGAVEPCDGLTSMGLTKEQVASTARFSFGWQTSREDLEMAAQQIATAYDALRSLPT